MYLFFLRPEFDRYARYNSWGSAREVFSWGNMCNTMIPLPTITEQQKVVNAWKAFREIKEQNEAKAAPLMQVCQSYIQELKHKYPLQEIGPYIEECDERNVDLSVRLSQGIANTKVFQAPKQVALNSNDRTQDSVLKMLAIGGEGDVIDRLMEMNIAPLAISYEYDPCDFLKAQEFQLKRDIEGYKKTTADDLLNMQTGLFGYKGRVHFQTGACMNDELAKMDRSLPKPELFARMSALIDKRIHASYRMYPNNYVAHDLLEGKEDFSDHYTAEDKQRFTAYIEQQLERISIPNKDVDFLRGKMLLMYANPLKNYLAAIKE